MNHFLTVYVHFIGHCSDAVIGNRTKQLLGLFRQVVGSQPTAGGACGPGRGLRPGHDAEPTD